MALHLAVCCNTIQHTATNGNTLQQYCYNTTDTFLQHPCNTTATTVQHHCNSTTATKLQLRYLPYSCIGFSLDLPFGRCIATHCNTRQYITTTLLSFGKCVATHCNTLQQHCNNTATARLQDLHFGVIGGFFLGPPFHSPLQRTATHGNTLQQQRTATHYNNQATTRHQQGFSTAAPLQQHCNNTAKHSCNKTDVHFGGTCGFFLGEHPHSHPQFLLLAVIVPRLLLD